MIKIDGKYNTALCYTNTLEPGAYSQIQTVCDEPAFSASKIRIMPDVHAGKGCTIGTTMTVTDKIVPGMVGVDIGCGMETIRIAEKELDLKKLDELIHREIPCGREVRSVPHAYAQKIDLSKLRCADAADLKRAMHSIGTLGGGNHFIEADRDEQENLYLVIHSGSRHIGCEVAEYYQNEGYQALCRNARHQISETRSIPKELAYVEGNLFDDYIHDMKLIQQFARLNRKAMAEQILRGMGLTETEHFTTIHNYIDTESMILRKGAVSAERGEKLLIPINMRDGSLICIGKGNDEWNRSAPHGAGRLMSRRAALQTLSMAEYREAMADIYSTCVLPDTLDESPMAYKDAEEIISQITPTAEIICRIKPIYNFKAAE